MHSIQLPTITRTAKALHRKDIVIWIYRLSIDE